MNWKHLTLGLGAALILGAAPLRAEAPAPVKIWIVHTNDLHGNLDPDDKNRGGMARIAGFLETLRAQHPGAVLFVDAGDIAQGTPVSNLFHGEPMFLALNDMKPAAGTLGNHEFDWGPEKMAEMARKADYPLLVANLVRESDGQRPFDAFRLVEVAGVKVGFLGLITPETPLYTKPGDTSGYRFLDPAATAKQYIPEMKAQGAEFIVAVTHLGVEADKELAAAVPEIDAIVGGHSHSKLPNGEKVGDTPIVQSDKYGRHVGVLELTLDPVSDKVLAYDARLIEVNDKAGLVEDAEVKAIAAKYQEQVKPIMAQVVGKAAVEMAKKYAAGQLDSPLGNVITDALRAKTGADVAVYNWGGIREDLIPSGEITKGTVFRVLPFDDQVVQLTLTGQDLMDLAVQGGLNKYGPMQIAGAEVVLDEKTQAVVSLKVGGKPVDVKATYTVATTEFLAGGGDGYKALTNGKVTKRYAFARDVFIDYVDDVQVVPAPGTGRIQLQRQ